MTTQGDESFSESLPPHPDELLGDPTVPTDQELEILTTTPTTEGLSGEELITFADGVLAAIVKDAVDEESTSSDDALRRAHQNTGKAMVIENLLRMAADKGFSLQLGMDSPEDS